jgi:hypothetical protein
MRLKLVSRAALALLCTFVLATCAQDVNGPAIEVWYGPFQVFGQNGVPQRWVDILGNVADPAGVANLTYSLNGGPQTPLSRGPDRKRLEKNGDFNIEIDLASLTVGSVNNVVITATDTLGNTSTANVVIRYEGGSIWPLPYFIDWSSVSEMRQVCQIVNGQWTIESGTIRPVVTGYDRLVAIGDIGWGDYEVTVPITIHRFDPGKTGGVGIVLRWDGHESWGSEQPNTGWYPLGAYGYYENTYRTKKGTYSPRLLIRGGNTGKVLAQDASSLTIELGVPYVFKMRVETVPILGPRYSLKVWKEGLPEPAQWNLTAQQSFADPMNGSMVLVSHHADASFGDVAVVPATDTIAPVVSNIRATAGDTWAAIDWDTNEPATSSVAYGLTATHELGIVSDATPVTGHRIMLQGLSSNSEYRYRITSVDGSGNLASITDLTIQTSPRDPASLAISDVPVVAGH